jgi:hypothetical protein
MYAGASGNLLRCHNRYNDKVESKAGRGSRSSLHLEITGCEGAVDRLTLFYTRKGYKLSHRPVAAQFSKPFQPDVISSAAKAGRGILRQSTQLMPQMGVPALHTVRAHQYNRSLGFVASLRTAWRCYGLTSVGDSVSAQFQIEPPPSAQTCICLPRYTIPGVQDAARPRTGPSPPEVSIKIQVLTNLLFARRSGPRA